MAEGQAMMEALPGQVHMGEPLGLSEESRPLEMLMYESLQSDLPTDESFIGRDDTVNRTEDEIPLFENDSSMAEVVDFMDYWPVHPTVSCVVS